MRIENNLHCTSSDEIDRIEVDPGKKVLRQSLSKEPAHVHQPRCRRHKLTRTEFAVVRAYAQGMRPVDIANRYLLDPDDDGELTEHQAIQRILGLRDRLIQFALQHERQDIAEMFDALKGRSNTGMGGGWMPCRSWNGSVRARRGWSMR